MVSGGGRVSFKTTPTANFKFGESIKPKINDVENRIFKRSFSFLIYTYGFRRTRMIQSSGHDRTTVLMNSEYLNHSNTISCSLFSPTTIIWYYKTPMWNMKSIRWPEQWKKVLVLDRLPRVSSAVSVTCLSALPAVTVPSCAITAGSVDAVLSRQEADWQQKILRHGIRPQ